jgi:N-acetyl-anhydromuramyl-L-alanine amidase AmpD
MKVIKKYSEFGGGTQTPNRLIIHSMSEFINGLYADEFLESIGLSAHFLLCPDGSFIKTKKTTLKAWHAKGHNTNTIGIEILAEGEHTYDTFLEKIKTDYVTEAQKEALVEMSNGIIEYYDIPHDKVLRHSDISPDRKYDPGSGFDWEDFKSKLI